MTSLTRGRRPWLDGVRAIAVTAVVLYHGGVSWLPGGFLGVDIFFVLSGYLITSLLLSELHRTGRIDLRAGALARAVAGPAADRGRLVVARSTTSATWR